MRRCPQCGTAGDDVYGFCIKCGYEFPKITQDKDTCPLCGYKNPEEAEFCVKCGTPLLFKKNPENNVKVVNPIVIQKEYTPSPAETDKQTADIYRILLCNIGKHHRINHCDLSDYPKRP